MTQTRTKGKIVPKVARKKTVSLLTGNKKVVCNFYCSYNDAAAVVARWDTARWTVSKKTAISWVVMCMDCYQIDVREYGVNHSLVLPFDEFERLLAPAITRELVAKRLEGRR